MKSNALADVGNKGSTLEKNSYQKYNVIVSRNVRDEG